MLIIILFVSFVWMFFHDCTMHYGPVSWVMMSSCMGIQSSKPGPTAAAVGSANQTTSADATPCGDKRQEETHQHTLLRGARQKASLRSCCWLLVRRLLPKKRPKSCGSIPIYLTEKGDITEAYFFGVIFRCNKFRVDRALKGDPEFAWCPSIHRQTTYDKAKSRGKITCLNQQTADF